MRRRPFPPRSWQATTRLTLTLAVFALVVAALTGLVLDRSVVADHVRDPALASELQASMRQRTLFVSIGATVVGALIGLVLARRVARPIGALRVQTREVNDASDLTARVDVGEGPPDLHGLADDINAMLERLERGAAVQRATLETARAFAAHASHELRTPLTALRADLDTLARHPELPVGTRQDILTTMQAEHGRLLGILETLRILARADLDPADSFESVDLVDLADRIVTRHRRRRPSADRGSITLDYRGDTSLRCWPEGMEAALDNLVRNALDHGETPVTVEVAGSDEAVEIVVRDRGEGFGPASEHLLGRFVKGPGSVGSGLGLALVAQQARLHGGEIELGPGPVVSLRLQRR